MWRERHKSVRRLMLYRLFPSLAFGPDDRRYVPRLGQGSMLIDLYTFLKDKRKRVLQPCNIYISNCFCFSLIYSLVSDACLVSRDRYQIYSFPALSFEIYISLITPILSFYIPCKLVPSLKKYRINGTTQPWRGL